MTWPLFNYPEWHSQPLNLTVDEMDDPLSVIAAFFDCYNLPESRVYLQEWLKDALQREDVNGGNLFVLHNNIVRLAEASWLVLQQRPELSRVIGQPIDANVNAALRLIVTAINPERIFLVGLNPIDLLIVMPDKAQKQFEEYEKLIEFALLNQEVITFSVLRSADLFTHLQKGHLFYSKVCVPANLVYANGIVPELPVAQKRLADVKAAAIRQFEAGFKPAEGFLQAAKLQLEQEQKALTAFMLHQAAELGIRAFILALAGQDIRSHEISVLRKYCCRYAPSLNEVFHREKEAQLLTLLDKAYKCSRYSPNYKISEDNLEVLMIKVPLLLQRLKVSFTEIVGS
jgi:HEPN domain-containing protein